MPTVVDEVVVRVTAQNAALASGLRQSEAMVAASTGRMNRTSSVGMSPRGLRGALSGFGLLGAGMFIEGAMDRWIERLRESEKVLRSNADAMAKFSAAVGAIPGIGSFFRAGQTGGNFLTGFLGREARAGGGLLKWLLAASPLGQIVNAAGGAESDSLKKMFDESAVQDMADLRKTIGDMIEAERARIEIIKAATDEEKQRLALDRDFAQSMREIQRLINEVIKQENEGVPGATDVYELIKELQREMISANEEAKKRIGEAKVKVGTDEFATPFGAFRVNQVAGDFRQEQPKEQTQKDIEENTAKTVKAIERVGRTLEGFTVVGFH